VTAAHFEAIAYVGTHAGDPYSAIQKSVEEVARHLKTFRTRTQKKVRSHWSPMCTVAHHPDAQTRRKSCRTNQAKKSRVCEKELACQSSIPCSSSSSLRRSPCCSERVCRM
jgi:hypothetical protein